ncbi:MAG: DUF4440 domain-containing protein [Edaphobacter sp.]
MSLAASVVFLRGIVYAQTTACTTDAADKEKVANTMRQMYVAAANDDVALFHRIAATDFYAFDGGHRFTGDALMELIQSAHKAGKHYVWTVNEQDVHLTCNDAWITYVNRGSVQDESGTKDLTWLESAFLHKKAGAWKIQFFHSTRVP